MATTPSKGKAGKGKKGSRRVYLALGLVALVVIGYIWYRGRSSTSLAASPSGASSGFPPGDSGSAGGISGSPLDQSGQDLSGLLGALQSENQGLLDAFVANQGRIVAPVGGVATASQQTPAVQAAAAPVAASSPVAASRVSPPQASGLQASDFSVQGIPVTGVSAPVSGFDQYPVLDLSNVQAPESPSYDSIQAAPLPVEAPASSPGGYPTLDLSNVPNSPSSPPVSSASGAAGVKSGATKVNYQAKARAA